MRETRDVQRLESEYRVTFPSGAEQIVSRREAARWTRLQALTDVVVVHLPLRLRTERDVEMCAGCKARPALWEHDCDGPYVTASCGSEQCDWWACNDTQNRQLEATCRNLSGDHARFESEGRSHNCYAVVGA